MGASPSENRSRDVWPRNVENHVSVFGKNIPEAGCILSLLLRHRMFRVRMRCRWQRSILSNRCFWYCCHNIKAMLMSSFRRLIRFILKTTGLCIHHEISQRALDYIIYHPIPALLLSPYVECFGYSPNSSAYGSSGFCPQYFVYLRRIRQWSKWSRDPLAGCLVYDDFDNLCLDCSTPQRPPAEEQHGPKITSFCEKRLYRRVFS